jgi:hypothetical protein
MLARHRVNNARADAASQTWWRVASKRNGGVMADGIAASGVASVI